MTEPPQKRRRALLDHVGNEIDQLETENSNLKEEMEQMRMDMAESKRVEVLRSEKISNGNTQRKRLEKRIKDKTKDLNECDSTIEDMWNEIATLKAQVRPLEDEDGEVVLELRDQVENLHDLARELRGEIGVHKSTPDGKGEVVWD